MPHEGFYFSITDAARFLNKSPVTLRKWEQTGFWMFPRDEHGHRKLGVADMAAVTQKARVAHRITANRQTLILTALEALTDIEKENS